MSDSYNRMKENLLPFIARKMSESINPVDVIDTLKDDKTYIVFIFNEALKVSALDAQIKGKGKRLFYIKKNVSNACTSNVNLKVYNPYGLTAEFADREFTVNLDNYSHKLWILDWDKISRHTSRYTEFMNLVAKDPYIKDAMKYALKTYANKDYFYKTRSATKVMASDLVLKPRMIADTIGSYVQEYQDEYKCDFGIIENDTFKSNFINTTEKEKTMLDKMKEQNSEAVKYAVQTNLGNVANTVLVEKIVPFLPENIQVYASTGVGKLVIANVVSVLLEVASGKVKDRATREKLNLVSDAMVNSAMLEVTLDFDIEGLVTGFLSDSRIEKVVNQAKDST